MSANDILNARRDAAAEYMRKITEPLWRAGEDIVFTQEKDTSPENAKSVLTVKAGRLYKGVLYSYAGGTAEMFFEYADRTDEKGIPVISGLSWDALSGRSDAARIGTDCSGAVERSWAAAGADTPAVSTLAMCPDNGFLHVGNFRASSDHVSSEEVKSNAPEIMYEAYALLQKSDAIVRRGTGSGHTRLVLGVHVVRNADGTIDPDASYAETLEQTRGFIRREHRYFDEKLGEDVYVICGNVKYTFAALYETGYMPVTCRAFTDPAPIPEPAVTDTRKEYGYGSLFDGELHANRLIDAVIMTVTDAAGKQVCRMVVPAKRSSRSFEMSLFLTENRAAVVGVVDFDALPDGRYHCKLVCRLSGDIHLTVRDFDFEK